MNKYDDRDIAFQDISAPCNPKPFINRLNEIVKNGSNEVNSKEFKSNLLILMNLAFNQLWDINSMDLYSDLLKEYNL